MGGGVDDGGVGEGVGGWGGAGGEGVARAWRQSEKGLLSEGVPESSSTCGAASASAATVSVCSASLLREEDERLWDSSTTTCRTLILTVSG